MRTTTTTRCVWRAGKLEAKGNRRGAEKCLLARSHYRRCQLHKSRAKAYRKMQQIATASWRLSKYRVVFHSLPSQPKVPSLVVVSNGIIIIVIFNGSAAVSCSKRRGTLMKLIIAVTWDLPNEAYQLMALMGANTLHLKIRSNQCPSLGEYD